jgi:hypothetical protein
MSGKRPSLAESMKQVAAGDPPPVLAAAPVAATPIRPAVPANEPSRPLPPKAFYAATRAGKKKATAPLSEEGHQQLRVLGIKKKATVEALLIEAINDLFRKNGLPPIA